jgi:hypothetical protein
MTSTTLRLSMNRVPVPPGVLMTKLPFTTVKVASSFWTTAVQARQSKGRRLRSIGLLREIRMKARAEGKDHLDTVHYGINGE